MIPMILELARDYLLPPLGFAALFMVMVPFLAPVFWLAGRLVRWYVGRKPPPTGRA